MTTTVQNVIPFKADSYQINYNNNKQTPPIPDDQFDNDMFILQAKELEKAKKKEKSQERWNKAGILAQIGIAVGIIGTLFLPFIAKKSLGSMKSTNVDKLNIIDVSKEKSFEELCLPDELKKVVEDIKIKIERKAALEKKGYHKQGGIILYGEPGGGKNAFTYALTKYYQKLFPGSELVMVDVNRFKGMFNGETENNIIDFVNNIQKVANKNPNKKYIVFLDEFDSIAKKATGSNENSSESFQNAFKTTLTNIMNIPNVEVIAATNKATRGESITKYLDSAIANRFPEKIYVPLPTIEQLKNAFVENFSRLPKECVVKELTQKDNKDLNKICEYIASKENHASFRDFSNIMDHAKIISEGPTRKSGTPISTDDLVDAVIKHADGNNWNIDELNKFRRSFGRPTTRTTSSSSSPTPSSHIGFFQRIINFFK